MVFHDPGDGARRQAHSELEQLTLDPAIAPSRVLSRQAHDECGRLVIDGWTTWWAMGVRPASGHQLTVPCQQRARRYSKSVPLGTRKQAAQGGQQRTIGGPVGGSSHLASKYCEFVAKSE